MFGLPVSMLMIVLLDVMFCGVEKIDSFHLDYRSGMHRLSVPRSEYSSSIILLANISESICRLQLELN